METIHTITYVAFDGTKFTDQKDCENYEKDCLSKMLNDTGINLPIENNCEDEDYEDECIFKILNDAGIRFFDKNFIPCIDATESVDAEYIYFPENEKAYDLYLKYFDSDVVPSFVDFAGKGLYYYDNNSYTYQLIRNKVGEFCL